MDVRNQIHNPNGPSVQAVSETVYGIDFDSLWDTGPLTHLVAMDPHTPPTNHPGIHSQTRRNAARSNQNTIRGNTLATACETLVNGWPRLRIYSPEKHGSWICVDNN